MSIIAITIVPTFLHYVGSSIMIASSVGQCNMICLLVRFLDLRFAQNDPKIAHKSFFLIRDSQGD